MNFEKNTSEKKNQTNGKKKILKKVGLALGLAAAGAGIGTAAIEGLKTKSEKGGIVEAARKKTDSKPFSHGMKKIKRKEAESMKELRGSIAEEKPLQFWKGHDEYDELKYGGLMEDLRDNLGKNYEYEPHFNTQTGEIMFHIKRVLNMKDPVEKIMHDSYDGGVEEREMCDLLVDKDRNYVVQFSDMASMHVVSGSDLKKELDEVWEEKKQEWEGGGKNEN